jgi:3-oxo-5-alpha-steroid 4-dehydrogenase 1
MSLPAFETLFWPAVTVGLCLSVLAFLGSMALSSPYGRFPSASFGAQLDPRWGWWGMEIMASIAFLYTYPLGTQASKPVPLIFAALYARHYLNRGWLFPLLMRPHPGARSFSVLVVACGVVVTTIHGYLNATWYGRYATFLDWDWFFSPCCLCGLILYEISFWSTIYCEHIMRCLRDGTGERYKIPRGFLFEYVSSPQYFTELLSFLGWTIMTWSPAGLVIFCISLANLVPRALQTHQWYREKFEDYPKNRKALIPFIL